MQIEEVWRSIEWTRGKYEVSNMGRVRSFARGSNGRVLKVFDDGKGYKALGLNVDGRYTMNKVHRLVATTFIPNPENKKTINHINGVKTDNRVVNLEWATYAENNEHAIATGLACQKGYENNNAKQVIDLSTGKIFKCAKDAAAYMGFKYDTFKSWLNGRCPNKSTLVYLKKVPEGR